MDKILIVVVEDNPQCSKLARDILVVHGFRVMECADAEAGLLQVKSERPHLVLMDIHLPGMDGLAAVRSLKACAETRRIPVIALTSLAMKGDKERILAAGCDGYIAKPFRMQDFIRQVRDALDPVFPRST